VVKAKGTSRSLSRNPSIAMYKPIDTKDRYHLGF